VIQPPGDSTAPLGAHPTNPRTPTVCAHVPPPHADRHSARHHTRAPHPHRMHACTHSPPPHADHPTPGTHPHHAPLAPHPHRRCAAARWPAACRSPAPHSRPTPGLQLPRPQRQRGSAHVATARPVLSYRLRRAPPRGFVLGSLNSIAFFRPSAAAYGRRVPAHLLSPARPPRVAHAPTQPEASTAAVPDAALRPPHAGSVTRRSHLTGDWVFVPRCSNPARPGRQSAC
jgi:hypothetical protein